MPFPLQGLLDNGRPDKRLVSVDIEPAPEMQVGVAWAEQFCFLAQYLQTIKQQPADRRPGACPSQARPPCSIHRSVLPPASSACSAPATYSLHRPWQEVVNLAAAAGVDHRFKQRSSLLVDLSQASCSGGRGGAVGLEAASRAGGPAPLDVRHNAWALQ